MVDHYLPEHISSAIALAESIQKEMARYESMIREVARQAAWVQSIADQHYEMLESSRRWAEGLALLHSELPKRGWYLTGKEGCTFTQEVARHIEKKDAAALDAALLAHATELSVATHVFVEWLAEQKVRDCCINRVRLFLEARAAHNHEVATLIGVPLLDELCRSLYGGKDFTTKRNRQPKPQIACSTGSGLKLNEYHKGFVEHFGLIHGDVDLTRAEDENYFNRSAIVHGLMRRSYGPKDSAKVFMAMMFLVFALDAPPADAEGSSEDAVAGSKGEG